MIIRRMASARSPHPASARRAAYNRAMSRPSDRVPRRAGLPAGAGRRPAGRRARRGLHDLGRRRAGLPGRRRRGDRRQRGPRPAVRGGRDGAPGPGLHLRPRHHLHQRAAGVVRPGGRAATCRSTRRPSTRSAAARRRSRAASRWCGPTTWPGASPIGRSSSPARAATTATRWARWTCPGREPLRRPYEPWLGRFRHVSAAYPYRAGEPAAHALGDVDALVAELEAAIAEAGQGRVAAFVAEPIVGATLGAVAPPDGYWPADRGGLPAPRRAARRGRGDDRLRADGALVRAGPLGRAGGRDGRGQGRRRGLLPVRPGRGERRGLRHDHGRRRLRPRVHLQPLTGGRGGGRRSAAHPGDGEARRGQRGEGRAAAGAAARIASAATPTSARSAAAACWWAWSWSPTGPRGGPSRARRA